jgi:hypothetical protein
LSFPRFKKAQFMTALGIIGATLLQGIAMLLIPVGVRACSRNLGGRSNKAVVFIVMPVDMFFQHVWPGNAAARGNADMPELFSPPIPIRYLNQFQLVMLNTAQPAA